MAETNLVCSSVNVASTKAGVNLDAIGLMGRIIKQTAELTKDNDSMGCSKLVVFANAVDDNPFMAGAFHGIGEPETVINVGVSGPGVVQSAIRRAGDCSIGEVADVIKKTAFKITRMGSWLVHWQASAWVCRSASLTCLSHRRRQSVTRLRVSGGSWSGGLRRLRHDRNPRDAE